jgi:hypothetical protein
VLVLLTGFYLEIFNSSCDSIAQGVHCFVHLEDNISEVLPYLNTKFGGFVYTQEPTCMVFASLVVEGVKDANDCSEITAENKEKLSAYLTDFKFD